MGKEEEIKLNYYAIMVDESSFPQFCGVVLLFKSAPFAMVPYLQPSGQAMVDLKLWFPSAFLGHKGLTAHRCSLYLCFSPPNA